MEGQGSDVVVSANRADAHMSTRTSERQVGEPQDAKKNDARDGSNIPTHLCMPSLMDCSAWSAPT
jgi:hypothetical protein